MTQPAKVSLNIEEIFSDQTSDADLLNSLEGYLGEIEDGMMTWLSRFDWDKNTLIEKFQNPDKPGLDCPYNTAHTKIKHANFNKHVEKCRLKSLHFSKQDLADYFKQPVAQNKLNQLYLNDHSKDLVRIQYDTHEEFKLAADLETFTSKQFFTDLTPKERLSLHEYVMQQAYAGGFEMKQPFLDLKDLDRSVSKEFKGDIDLRDIKRRPKSYKTGQSSTYTEKIKELIDFQMSLMKEFAEREAEVRDRQQSEKRKKKKKRSKHESGDDDDDDELDGQARHRSHKKKSKKRKSRKSSRSESPTDLIK